MQPFWLIHNEQIQIMLTSTVCVYTTYKYNVFNPHCQTDLMGMLDMNTES